MTRPTAARPDAIRRHNLAMMLGELHQHGEMSRAQLTSELGLNRSTIGALVADLAGNGLINERAPGTRTGAGRPSHLVGPRTDGPFALAIDIDVHQLEVAAVGLGGQVMARHTVQLTSEHASPSDVVAAVSSAHHVLKAEVPPGTWPVGIGVSVPGTVRRVDGEILVAPNLGWHNVSLGPAIQSAIDTKLPIQLGNDADLGALAEHLRGAARGVNDVLFLNGRVGVGGGVIADGRGLRGASGLAGEVGHMVVDPAGPLCHCGNRGCFETFIGERAILRAAGRAQGSGPDAIAEVVYAALRGDRRAAQAMDFVSQWLGRGLASIASILNPAVIVIGGSLTIVSETHAQQIRTAFDQNMGALPADQVEIRSPELGTDSALLGAAELAFTSLLDDPVAVANSLKP